MPRIITTASPLPPPLPAVAWPFAGAAVAAGIAAGTEDTDAWRCEGEHAILCGGEPLLQAGVIDWIAALKAGGGRAVEVWTDGQIVARRGAAERLRDAGLTDIGIILFGAGAAAHDFVAGVPGHFTAAIRGLRMARKAGLRTAVIAPILRPTLRELPLLVQRSLAIGVGRFELLALPGPDRTKHGLLPHLAIAAPHIVTAIKAARASRRVARTWGVPHCLLGELATAGLDARALAPDIASYFATNGAAACQVCSVRPSCGGPLPGYLDQHGDAGLLAKST
jgi:hypothetical protein